MSYTMTFDMPQKTAAYVERRGPRYRAELNAIFVAIVTSSMKNEEAMAEEPQPLSSDDPRIEAAVSAARVKRVKTGVYQAETPALDGYWSEGKTRSAALADLRDNLRYLISEPAKVRYSVGGRRYLAEARPCREGGFWATVPKLGGAATQGDTMDELREMLVDMTQGLVETK